MRTISAALVLALSLLPSAAVAQDGGAQPPACRTWDGGAAARRNGWTLTELQGVQRAALLRHYDERVAPRADPRSDRVVVASHPEWPTLRVIIVRGDCIVDMGQMGPEALERILRKPDRPA